ncbi:MAG: peptidoglycan-binding protein [Euryarchaeota archaeon]|jgi:N-acetylmuramoyl-L-alanine amidase|nr:peptidoglycan-binding protein [Euryarchaeota archaeon]
MLFALSLVLAAIPLAGAVQDQNSENKYVKDIINPQVTGDENKEVKNILQEQKPFGSSTDEILGNNPDELKLGATGDQVKEVQEWLYDYGYYTGSVDGNFGSDTEEAVRIFQEEAGIQIDGVVGDETKKAMEKWDQYLAQVQAYSESQSSTSQKSDSSLSSRNKKSQSVSRKKQNSHTSAKKRAYAKSFRTVYRSSGGRGIGDCWDNSAYLYQKITSSGSKARIIQYATSQSSRHRSVQVYSNGKWVNYDYKANGYAQRYYATSNSVNGVVIKSS